jgi:hypothetical protein
VTMAPHKSTRTMASRAATSTAEPEEEIPKAVKAKKIQAKKKAAPKAKKTTKEEAPDDAPEEEVTKTGTSVTIEACNGGMTKAKNIVKALKGKRVIKHASVYMATACKSEFDSGCGSNYCRSYYVKEKYNQQILVVFFSAAAANACAKAYRNKLCGDDDEEDDDDDDDNDEENSDIDDDDLELFCYDGSDDHKFDDQYGFDKVWVERRAINDASRDFHR